MNGLAGTRADADPIPAVSLGLVQSLVGVAQQDIEIFTGLAKIAANTDGYRCSGALAFLLDAGANTTGDLLQRGGIAG
jgi:hypothetical protein